jgi:hypothetical protein
MPPGGIIGKTPGGEPAAGRFGPQRVNPVGGVIGESGGGRGTIGGGGRGGMSSHGNQPYGQAGGRSGRRGQSEDIAWDPDNPWATDEGVDPVVLPAVEQRIDPGPAIGLG